MTITRTPRQQNDDNIFDNPTAQIFEDVDNENGRSKAEEESDKVKDLEDRLAKLQERLETRDSDLEYLSPSRTQSQVSEGPVIVDPNSIKLPDPALDPDGFSEATQRRTQIVLDNDRRRQEFTSKRNSDISAKVDDLWERFGDTYPDMAENKERIDYIASQLAQDAARRGVDPQQYMFGTKNRFMKDVAKKYVEIFGEPETDDNDDFEDTRSRKAGGRTQRRANSRNREEEDDGRSTSIFGGNQNSGRQARKSEEDNGSSMIDDLQAIQKKSGFM